LGTRCPAESYRACNEAFEGYAQVMVAGEERRGRATVRGYLADVHCLGVKNTLGPETMDVGRLPHLSADLFQVVRPTAAGDSHRTRPRAGNGVGGLRPWVRFRTPPGVRRHIRGIPGQWNGPSPITFGRDGMPFYASGPYDNPTAVLRTLEQSAGAGNFHFAMTI